MSTPTDQASLDLLDQNNILPPPPDGTSLDSDVEFMLCSLEKVKEEKYPAWRSLAKGLDLDAGKVTVRMEMEERQRGIKREHTTSETEGKYATQQQTARRKLRHVEDYDPKDETGAAAVSVSVCK